MGEKQPDETKQATLEEVQQAALNTMLKYMEGNRDDLDEDDHWYAQKSLAAVGRIKATERARDATQFMVIGAISENKQEFKRYIEVALPHLNPSRLLPRPE